MIDDLKYKSGICHPPSYVLYFRKHIIEGGFFMSAKKLGFGLMRLPIIEHLKEVAEYFGK